MSSIHDDFCEAMQDLRRIERAGVPFFEISSTWNKRKLCIRDAEKLLEQSRLRLRRLETIRDGCQSALSHLSMAKRGDEPRGGGVYEMPMTEQSLLNLMLEEVKERASEERLWRKWLKTKMKEIAKNQSESEKMIDELGKMNQ